jgi:hypothetical protein
MARRKGRRWAPGPGRARRELFRAAGAYHSRLQNIEYECWVFAGRLPPAHTLAQQRIDEGDAYFWRLTFDPATLQVV